MNTKDLGTDLSPLTSPSHSLVQADPRKRGKRKKWKKIERGRKEIRKTGRMKKWKNRRHSGGIMERVWGREQGGK